MRVAFYTLGCKLNQSESEALASTFRSQGFSVLGPDDEADIYIVNTCTVTSKAEQKARRMIRKFAQKDSAPAVILMGCYVQMDAEELAELDGNLFLFKKEEKGLLLELPAFLAGFSGDGQTISSAVEAFCRKNTILQGTCRAATEPGPARENPPSVSESRAFDFFGEDYSYHSRAFLKIQDGCDNHCRFCRVRLARGKAVSLELPEAVRRFRLLEEAGYREIVLTGVNMAAYSGGGRSLAELLEELITVRQKARIRLSSLEPDRLSPALLDVLSDPAICPHFHIPIQSGSDRVLRNMARKNTRREIAEALEQLKKTRPGVFLAADFIVGFPGETEEDYSESESLAREAGLSELHVFPFSPRKDTAGWDLKPRVPERVAGERCRRLRELSNNLYQEYLDSCLGRSFDFLLEERDFQDTGLLAGGGPDTAETFGGSLPMECWRGTSENYLRLPVFLPSGEAGKGRLCRAEARLAHGKKQEPFFYAQFL